MNSKLFRVMGILLLPVLVMMLITTPVQASEEIEREIKGELEIWGTIDKILYPDGKTLLKVDFGGPHAIPVWVDGDTEIDGELAVYAGVAIKAEFEDNKLVAEEITVREINKPYIKGELELRGTIAKILYPMGKTLLKVDVGKMHPVPVFVTEDTDIDGKLKVGEEVRIDAEFMHDKLVADEITVRD